MHVTEVVLELGGIATWADLARRCPRRAIEAAIASGDLVREGRGRLALPTAPIAIRAAHRWSGVVSHLSAAELHGWSLKHQPRLPHVTVSPSRKLPADIRDVVIHRARLGAEDHVGGVTSATRTLEDCLRTLPLDEGLCVADSALRMGAITPMVLQALAAGSRGPGSRGFRRAASLADGRSSGALESVLRAICLDVPGLRVEPQVRLTTQSTFLGRPDLVDVDLRLILEADSFEWHGHRRALKADARRYNAFVAAGWTVLRFTYEDVMGRPDAVRAVIEDAIARLTPTLRAQRRGKRAC